MAENTFREGKELLDKLQEDLKASGCTVFKKQLFPELEE